MPIPQEPNRNLMFGAVTQNHEVQGGANRQEALANVTRTGLTSLNVESSDQFTELFFETKPEGQTEPVQLLGATGGNEETGEVAVYKALPTDVRKIAIKYDPKTRTYSFHLGAAFKQYPKLRPIGTRECPVRLDRDAMGRPCFVISIGVGKVKQRGTRASKNGTQPKPEQPAVGEAETE